MGSRSAILAPMVVREVAMVRTSVGVGRLRHTDVFWTHLQKWTALSTKGPDLDRELSSEGPSSAEG